MEYFYDTRYFFHGVTTPSALAGGFYAQAQEIVAPISKYL